MAFLVEQEDSGKGAVGCNRKCTHTHNQQRRGRGHGVNVVMPSAPQGLDNPCVLSKVRKTTEKGQKIQSHRE